MFSNVLKTNLRTYHEEKMLKNTKYRNGHLPIPGAKSAVISPQKLKNGLIILEKLWKRGLLPDDLRAHFIFMWFCQNKGNMTKQAPVVGLHRNTLLTIFSNSAKKGTRNLKSRWLFITRKYSKKSFGYQYFVFYKYAVGKSALTEMESSGLVDLWLMGFPQKILKSHFVLWAFQNGLTRKQVAKILDQSIRSLHRICAGAAKKGSPTMKWLSPLNLNTNDFYPPNSNSPARRKKVKNLFR